MKLRVEKINHIAHLIADHIVNSDNVTCYENKNTIRLLIKKRMIDELKLDDLIDRRTRQRLQSYSRNIAEGSREWDVLYQKTFEEEMTKVRAKL